MSNVLVLSLPLWGDVFQLHPNGESLMDSTSSRGPLSLLVSDWLSWGCKSTRMMSIAIPAICNSLQPTSLSTEKYLTTASAVSTLCLSYVLGVVVWGNLHSCWFAVLLYSPGGQGRNRSVAGKKRTEESISFLLLFLTMGAHA